MISYYELLGMIKEDKTPEKIRVHLTPNTSRIYVRENDIDDTFSYYGLLNGEEENADYNYYLAECLLESSMFDKNIEIIEEENKLPEKLQYYDDSIAWVIDGVGHLSGVDKVIIDTLNQVIDYLQSKGE